MALLLATHNAHKTREFAELLGCSVSDLTSRSLQWKIEETGSSFAENAAIKAVAVSGELTDEIVLADDSGLEVDALGGAPGIFSARYAGAAASDRDNLEKLLRELHRIGVRESAARFVCALALAKSGEIIFAAEGIAAGTIINRMRGTKGFGYDPVFVPEGMSRTFAELAPELKNKISHRARAAQHLKTFFNTARLRW